MLSRLEGLADGMFWTKVFHIKIERVQELHLAVATLVMMHLQKEFFDLRVGIALDSRSLKRLPRFVVAWTTIVSITVALCLLKPQCVEDMWADVGSMDLYHDSIRLCFLKSVAASLMRSMAF
jgi:hypothetical protein